MVEFFFETTVSKKTKIFIKIPFFYFRRVKRGEKKLSFNKKKDIETLDTEALQLLQ